MRRNSIIVGLAQMRETKSLSDNLHEIWHFVRSARKDGAEMVVFPECALTGYGPAYHKSSASFDPDAVNAAVVEVRGLARETRTAIVLGAHLPAEAAGWMNSVLLIGADGKVLTRYDKAHLYDRDAEYYRAGRAAAEVASVKGVRVGLQTCFDIRFPEPFLALALAGAQMIVVPSHVHGKSDMWKNPVFEAHVRSRAAENGRFVVFVNAAGPEQNVPSMIADPRGELVAKCHRAARHLLVVRLAVHRVSDDFLRCRRMDLYG